MSRKTENEREDLGINNKQNNFLKEKEDEEVSILKTH